MWCSLLLMLVPVVTSFPVLWDMPEVTPISYQDFYSQIHHRQEQMPASVIVIDVPVQDVTSASVPATLATDVPVTSVPLVTDTYAVPTTTMEMYGLSLSAAVATTDVVDHFLTDFLEEESAEYSMSSVNTLASELVSKTTAPSEYFAVNTSQTGSTESTANCYQLVLGSPLSIVTMALLSAGNFSVYFSSLFLCSLFLVCFASLYAAMRRL